MLRRYRLEPLNGLGEALEFAWDPETGELTGRDAIVVRRHAEQAAKRGLALGHPYPTAYDIVDPLRRPGELAVLLGNVFKLPADLRAAYPGGEDKAPAWGG